VSGLRKSLLDVCSSRADAAYECAANIGIRDVNGGGIKKKIVLLLFQKR
jgi:hypothetical protein